MNTNRFLLAAIIILATIFTSCSQYDDTEEQRYFAIISTTHGISYASLYPHVIMEPGGYFLNEMAQYASGRNGHQYKKDICNRIAFVCTPEEMIIATLFPMDCCDIKVPIYDMYPNRDYNSNRDGGEMRDWLKSVDMPFYNDINSEIFADGNSKFLGFYRVDGEERYISVWKEP